MSDLKSRRIPKPIWFGIAAVLMVVLAVFLHVWIPYHREQVVIRKIERTGGEVTTFWYGPKWIRNGPDWLSKRVYDGSLSWFDRVIWVVLAETPITDEGLKLLSDFTNFSYLFLNKTQVSDEGLEHLSERYCQKLCS